MSLRHSAILRCWRHVSVTCAVAVTACSGSTEPAVAFPLSSLAGQYRVMFTAEGTGALACDEISVDMATMRWLPVDCRNPLVVPDFTPAAVFIRNDSLFLNVTAGSGPLGDSRRIEFGYFNTRGSTDVINARWRGMICHPITNSDFCSIESGTAQFARP
jgi:hypothetical protein